MSGQRLHERTFDVPRAAAGPLVTPTKPISGFGLSANAVPVRAVISTTADATPKAFECRTLRSHFFLQKFARGANFLLRLP